jgi:hypothetical protein
LLDTIGEFSRVLGFETFREDLGHGDVRNIVSGKNLEFLTGDQIGQLINLSEELFQVK